MKRLYSCAVLALFLLAAILSGCSSAVTEQSGQNTQGTPLITETGWTPVLECKITPPTYIVGFLNEHFGVSLGVKGEINYTGDGGQTWTEGANGILMRLCLDIVDDNTAWCGGNGGSVYMTNNGGKIWTRVNDINLIMDHHNIDFIDDTAGWIATRSRLAGTNDGGQTWTEIPLPESADGVAAICLRTQDIGYLLSRDGMLYATDDGGTTWSSQDLGFKNYDITDLKKQPKLNKMSLASADLSFVDENNGTIVFIGKSASGQGYHTWCLTTDDGGATWESELIPETGFTPSKVFISGDSQYLTLSDASNNAIVLKKKA